MPGINYSLIQKTYNPDQDDLDVKVAHPPRTKDDWLRSQYKNFKSKIKAKLYVDQNTRCAYCRNELEGGARYEHIEHIVAKKLKPVWLLEPANLVLACSSCNGDKGTKPVLSEDYENSIDFPMETNAFEIFNPHFDEWKDHFCFEKSLFIIPIPDSKGENTIKICRLFRFNIIINRARELKLGQKKPMAACIHRLQSLDVNSVMYEENKDELLNAMNEYTALMNENENVN